MYFLAQIQGVLLPFRNESFWCVGLIIFLFDLRGEKEVVFNLHRGRCMHNERRMYLALEYQTANQFEVQHVRQAA